MWLAGTFNNDAKYEALNIVNFGNKSVLISQIVLSDDVVILNFSVCLAWWVPLSSMQSRWFWRKHVALWWLWRQLPHILSYPALDICSTGRLEMPQMCGRGKNGEFIIFLVWCFRCCSKCSFEYYITNNWLSNWLADWLSNWFSWLAS